MPLPGEIQTVLINNLDTLAKSDGIITLKGYQVVALCLADK